MAEYLESMGARASMQDVYDGLHHPGQELADEVCAPFGNRKLPVLDFVRVPGTYLEVRRMVTTGDMPGRTFFDWLEIQERDAFTNKQFEVVEFNPRPGSHRNHADPDFRTQPAWIAAFRGNETSPDYYLSSRGVKEGRRGLIVCRLDNMGLYPFMRDSGKVPIGMDIYEPQRRIGDLSEEERLRLSLVTQGIAQRLAIVRALKDGAPLTQVLTRMQVEAQQN